MKTPLTLCVRWVALGEALLRRWSTAVALWVVLGAIGAQPICYGCNWSLGLGAIGALDWVLLEPWIGCYWSLGLGAIGALDAIGALPICCG